MVILSMTNPSVQPYMDADGNAFAFGFGMNCSGVISDVRTLKYTQK